MAVASFAHTFHLCPHAWQTISVCRSCRNGISSKIGHQNRQPRQQASDWQPASPSLRWAMTRLRLPQLKHMPRPVSVSCSSASRCCRSSSCCSLRSASCSRCHCRCSARRLPSSIRRRRRATSRPILATVEHLFLLPHKPPTYLTRWCPGCAHCPALSGRIILRLKPPAAVVVASPTGPRTCEAFCLQAW